MTEAHDIITDEELARVHANAKFGSMTPREVVNDGVQRYAIGYQGGSTQVAILRGHGLISKPKNCGYKANLTEKGKRYARAIYPNTDTLRAEADSLRAALVAALAVYDAAELRDGEPPEATQAILAARAALQAHGEAD
jgi:hypothetical protein